jgi:hypothetical protein
MKVVIPDQADVEAKIEMLEAEAKALTAHLKSISVTVPTAPQKVTYSDDVSSYDTILYSEQMEAHVAKLKALKQFPPKAATASATAPAAAAKPLATPAAPVAPVAKLTATERCKADADARNAARAKAYAAAAARIEATRAKPEKPVGTYTERALAAKQGK